MEDVLWILTLKNKIMKLPLKRIAFNWNCIALFGYYLEYYQKYPRILHWEVDKWEINIHYSPIVFIACFDLCINDSCPKIDPKKRKLGNGKYYQLKFILVLFMSMLAFIILHLTQNPFCFKSEFDCHSAGILLMR
jgi:hypothetical protein